MPRGSDSNHTEGAVPPGPGLGRRLGSRREANSARASVGERLRALVLKPVQAEPDPATRSRAGAASLGELESQVRSANDKERLIGLLAAPVAAAIGIVVISTLIVNDPPARLQNGQVDPLHVSLSLYHDLGGVVLTLSILMLVSAMWRKRVFLGIVTALYGLAIFNLHYWGFGVPFILVSAWLLVRAYRLQRDLREAAEGSLSHTSRWRPSDGATPRRPAPKPSSRYTPPAAPARRLSPAKPATKRQAR